VWLSPKEGGRFEVTADVSISPVFLGWIFQFGKLAEIKAPDKLIAAMKLMIEENANVYKPPFDPTLSSF
jgi:predicted DNA-binding transcriptional regulator YafY